VAENPEILGIGIDEDTAIRVYPDQYFSVLAIMRLPLLMESRSKAVMFLNRNRMKF
jgi:cyanophycinase